MRLVATNSFKLMKEKKVLLFLWAPNGAFTMEWDL